MPAKLRIVGGRNVDHVYRIDEGPATVIGRSSRADIRVADENASRRHCRIECLEGRWTITDLDSMNGTHVNKERVTETELAAGDQVRVAGVVYEFLIDGDDASNALTPPPGDDTEVQDASPGPPSPAAVCAQCGRDLPPNAVEAGSATEIGGRLFCSRCVVDHPEPGEAAEAERAPKSLTDTGESSEFGSLLRSLERATEADRIEDAPAPPPPPESGPETEPPPKSRGGLLDRLRGRKTKE